MTLRATLLALPFVALGLGAAHAQTAAPATPGAAASLTPAQAQALRTACEADVSKLWTGIQPGGGRIIQCLREKQEQVSPPCKASLGALATSMRKPAAQ
ncbi:cysteine rich repeat-containing protein [Xanthobacter sp. KR7-65]|uniref:cysteine rich repeat-containing protein n=1 Tax=Xanthobacter sp. KR7-65 TaxID=3156612 RepID=UPI0032B430C2